MELGGSSVLISGGSGAFGNAFVCYLLGRQSPPPSRVAVYSRGEHRQFLMAQELKPLDPYNKLRFLIGDIRDRERLRRALEGVDIVVHAAALKRIEVGSYNPLEMKKTNIDGAASLIEAAHDAGVKKIVALSSDKAFEPVSPYGLSKAYAEFLFLASNNTTGNKGPKCSITRYGNVWNSTGSVVPIWRQQLRDGDTVNVTSPSCTRFFMRMQEAVDLVLQTIKSSVVGEIVIPTLPAYQLADLAAAMGAKMNVVGLPPWEKEHESMDKGNSSDRARRMSVDELREALQNG
jgi:UDP-N-acetylglucosamine 4,6-dehydratase